jgi:type II secretory pathway predicted ATPase ExeA
VSIDKLASHYGFTRMPFRRDLAPGQLHRCAPHAEAVARIRWLVAEAALGVLTGEVGAGKTVAVRAALAALDPSRHTIIYLGNPAVGTRGIYHGIVTALGGVPRFHKAALIPQTRDALAAEHSERGRQVVLVVDEAHLLNLLNADQLEELRLLTNADMDSRAPFAGLLIGQPTLRRRIKLGAFAALDQRIALRYAMPGLQPTETKAYLAHHLALVGRSDTLFSDDAIALIYQVSRGLPRAINTLAVQALIAAYATNKAIIDESSTQAAVTEITTD